MRCSYAMSLLPFFEIIAANYVSRRLIFEDEARVRQEKTKIRKRVENNFNGEK